MPRMHLKTRAMLRRKEIDKSHQNRIVRLLALQENPVSKYLKPGTEKGLKKPLFLLRLIPIHKGGQKLQLASQVIGDFRLGSKIKPMLAIKCQGSYGILAIYSAIGAQIDRTIRWSDHMRHRIDKKPRVFDLEGCEMIRDSIGGCQER